MTGLVVLEIKTQKMGRKSGQAGSESEYCRLAAWAITGT